MDNKTIGSIGEDFAQNHYRRIGYEIRERNYRSRFGEIDLVAQNDGYICFVEVKTRNENRIGQPCEAVDAAKKKRIIRTAVKYIAENDVDKQPRFDVFEVVQNEGRVYWFRLIENAFDLNDLGDDYGVF